MAATRWRPGRAYVLHRGSQTLAVRILADGRVLVEPVLPGGVVAPARRRRPGAGGLLSLR